MSEILVKDKDIVIPGQLLATGMDYLPASGTLRDSDKIVSSIIGIASLNGRLIKIIPLTGPYVPRRDDVVIGKVVDIGFSGWRVDIGWAYQANLSIRDATQEFVEKGSDLTQYYNYGDYIMTRITNVAGSKIIDLGMRGPGLRKLTEGRLIKIIPSKVPRVIGKQGSMITMIKENTNSRILVGQNGFVWISGVNPEDETRAIEAIKMIDQESQTDGLTESIEKFLKGEKK
ncbi:MAG: exosome complex protein Rrp4 [Nanoarchaeota archaeon]|nr:exosome complex protein Rrp4 [Nanoarchaeota archaeon]MBU0962393.1 exosome complex protein Rrp4 [Nanoarchaeota archaeon]